MNNANQLLDSARENDFQFQRFAVHADPRLSMGWVDPWLGLGWVDIFQFLVGWVGSGQLQQD